MNRWTVYSMPRLVIPIHRSTAPCLNGFYFAAAFLISALVLLAYHPILSCFFTGTDTLTLIQTSRINAFGDIARIFSAPLMDETEFTKIGLFYRPVSVLTYSVDSLLWGLNPLGFHLTNLLLHIAVGFLVVVLMVNLSGGDFLLAGLTAGIFVLHPILAESIPAIDRRHDLVASLFLLLTLIFFVKSWLQNRSRKLLLSFSLASYCLALGSKEIAVVVPALIWVYVILFLDDESSGKKISSAFRLTGPYLIETAFYLVIRWNVLGCLGGYQVRPDGEWHQILAYLTNIVHSYFRDLWYPVDLLNVTESLSVCASTIALVLFSTLYATIAFNIVRQPTEGVQRHCHFRLTAFFISWCVLPLGMFLGTLTFGHRNMYMPAIPFSAIIAFFLLTSVRSLRGSYRNTRHVSLTKAMYNFLGVRVLILVVSCAVAISLVAYSPLCRRYGHWEDSAQISSLLLKNLSDAIKTLPKTVVIHVHNLPESITSYRKRIPHTREVTYLRDYSIKSWLDLCYPNNMLRVIVHSRSHLAEFSGFLNVRIRSMGSQAVYVTVNGGKLRISRLK